MSSMGQVWLKYVSSMAKGGVLWEYYGSIMGDIERVYIILFRSLNFDLFANSTPFGFFYLDPFEILWFGSPYFPTVISFLPADFH